MIEGFDFIDAGGNGRESLVSRNQINIRPDLIDKSFIEIARYPKATHKEFPATTVICNAITVAQIDQEARYDVRLSSIIGYRSMNQLVAAPKTDGESDDGLFTEETTQIIRDMTLMR